MGVGEEKGACGGGVGSLSPSSVVSRWRGGGSASALDDGRRRLAWLAEGLEFGD